MIVNSELLSSVFYKNRKCVINTDLDGLLSGMLLQEFLNWEIVGFSSCCGKPNDNLWLKDKGLPLNECVFVDLPVAVKYITIIDQHFVTFDGESLVRFNLCGNKINPNIMRSRTYKNNDYVKKYPFGTIHFILAILERLNLLPQNFNIEFHKNFGNYDLADLILRADRVVGNTACYTPNCLDWINWLIEFGGKATQELFNVVKLEYSTRLAKEHYVEEILKRLGCAGLDGECSNLFRIKDMQRLNKYFEFLSQALNMRPLRLFDYFSYDNLIGEKVDINSNSLETISELIKKENLFSYAFVTTRTLSLTYKKETTND